MNTARRSQWVGHNEFCVRLFSAKNLIKGLLKTDPDHRLNIEQVMRNKWIAVSVYMSWMCLGVVMHLFVFIDSSFMIRISQYNRTKFYFAFVVSLQRVCRCLVCHLLSAIRVHVLVVHAWLQFILVCAHACFYVNSNTQQCHKHRWCQQ